ncbi:MAG: PepSY-associated TM helix domain-containing protein [Puniceicoccaceae bacterium]
MRKILLWIHLISGVSCGLFIAMMCATGIAIAFKQDILNWIDRPVTHLSESSQTGERHSADAVLAWLAQYHADLEFEYLEIPADPLRAYTVYDSHYDPSYINPYALELIEAPSHTAHHLLHTLETWHRFAGLQGEHWFVGRLINGTANLMFVVLCLTGLVLWFPRRWRWRLLRQNLQLNSKARRAARRRNQHQVFGFWSFPVLLLLAATGVVISFEWAHKLVFVLAGETPSQHRTFRMLMLEPPEVDAEITQHAERPLFQTTLQSVAAQFPDWTAVEFQLPPAGERTNPKEPLTLYIHRPSGFVTKGLVFAHAHPVTGELMQVTQWHERSRGIRARVWVRFLHTGEAFGFLGKLVASLACTAGLILVYTGFALALQRWKRSRAP